jgi:hypothetical protein
VPQPTYCVSAWGLDADRRAKCLIENDYANVTPAPIHMLATERAPLGVEKGIWSGIILEKNHV